MQEIITRVLLERLIVHRPHPWGLLITFIELIKNPRYRFWTCKFVRCAPEVFRLFQSVATTCLGDEAAAHIVAQTGGVLPPPEDRSSRQHQHQQQQAPQAMQANGGVLVNGMVQEAAAGATGKVARAPPGLEPDIAVSDVKDAAKQQAA